MGQEVEETTVEDTATETKVAEETKDDQGAGQETPSQNSGEQKSEAQSPPAPRKFKVKVDGQELEVDEDDLVKSYQIESTARRRLTEATTLQKQVKDVVDLLDKDFLAAAEQRLTHKLGSKAKAREAIRQDALKIINEWMVEEEMTEEDRQRKAREEQLAERERAIKAKEDADERTRNEAAVQEQEKIVSQEIGEAITKSGLPDNEGVREMFIRTWLFADQNGIELTWDQISKEVRKARREGARELAKTMSPKEFREEFKDLFDAARKDEIEALRKTGKPSTSQPATPQGAAAGDGQRRGRSPREFRSWSEYQRHMEERFGG